MARIGDRPFIDILLDVVLQYGFKRIVLSVGYLKEQIKDYIDQGFRRDSEILFSEEEYPLGTGGGVKKARSLIRSSPFLVMNGDSICKVDLRAFFDFHTEKQSLLSIVLACSKRSRDYGSVRLDRSERIISFNEKITHGSGNMINAGIYLMQEEVFSYMPAQDQFSLEYDFFPEFIHNRCYGFLVEDEVIDIGTPERYEKAINLLSGTA